MSNSSNKGKPKLNMTTKDLSRKQIIISMSTNNMERVLANSNVHVVNINRLLKGIKLKISAGFIYSNNKEVIITTNKIVFTFDMNIIEKYMKELNDVNLNDIISPRLLQSKLYLKILGISYFIEDTNPPIILDIIERVIKTTHIFDDTVLASYPRVIKASPKSDMTIVWVDIWDFQNSTKAKSLINRSFNIGHYIVMIKETNMNLSILQYKNCWK